MTAPSATARGTPTGIRLEDGYQTLITFATDATVEFYEKTVQPPGLDGGDAVENTTMHNSIYRTFSSRSLITMTEAATTVAYDPKVYDAIIALINVETTVTITFSDGSTLAFFGYLRTFEPQDCEEGSQPEANITVQPTNKDCVTPFTEEAPVMVEAAGT